MIGHGAEWYCGPPALLASCCRPRRREEGPALSAKPTALVVEDDGDVQLLWRLVLEGAGMQVFSAKTERDALDQAAAHRPDVILLDLKLQGGSGWDVLDALNKDPSLAEVPVIVLTGSADAPSDERMGRATYLAKPVKNKDLLEAVRAVQASGDAPAER
ncbi:MAG TPA: response regulator [Actinomycetota bacterium]|nr:response regulator [Actinomycetota bacterium]